MMRTRLHKWLDMKTMKPAFGLQVQYEGKWLHAHENGKALIFKTEKEALSKRAELRRMPNDQIQPTPQRSVGGRLEPLVGPDET